MEEKFKKSLIGLDVSVINSKIKTNIGIKGKIVDETKNTIIIKDQKGDKKMMLKKNIFLKEKMHGNIINGKSLVGRVEERIKK